MAATDQRKCVPHYMGGVKPSTFDPIPVVVQQMSLIMLVPENGEEDKLSWMVGGSIRLWLEEGARGGVIGGAREGVDILDNAGPGFDCEQNYEEAAMIHGDGCFADNGLLVMEGMIETTLAKARSGLSWSSSMWGQKKQPLWMLMMWMQCSLSTLRYSHECMA